MNLPALALKAALLASIAFPFGLAMRAQEPFHPNKHLYDEQAIPAQQIAAAQKTAAAQHKHILLEFGGNWCGDCQLLNYYYHQPPNAQLIESSYVLVYIDIGDDGDIDKNLDVAKKYGVQIMHGVPGLAVLDAGGKVLYAQHEKEFEHATPEQLHALLTRYKG